MEREKRYYELRLKSWNHKKKKKSLLKTLDLKGILKKLILEFELLLFYYS
jgi:hypothetical protein